MTEYKICRRCKDTYELCMFTKPKRPDRVYVACERCRAAAIFYKKNQPCRHGLTRGSCGTCRNNFI